MSFCCSAFSVGEMDAKDKLPAIQNDEIESERVTQIAVGSAIINEFRRVVQTTVSTALSERMRVEELEEKVRNYEDYIACLEEQVRELQHLVLQQADKVSTSGESIHSVNLDDPPQPRQQAQQRQQQQQSRNWMAWGLSDAYRKP
eukprot:gene1445-1570_t